MAANGDQEEEYSFNEDVTAVDETYGSEPDLSADLSLQQDGETGEGEVSVAEQELQEGNADGDKAEGGEEGVEDPELEAIKARVREMEEEAEKLKEMQSDLDLSMNLSSSSITSPQPMSMEDKIDVDTRSIWVGNVDYGATAEELEAHFHGCGSINRVTILCDKFSGHPKGFAYVEFTDKDSVQTAQALDESLFRGRQIKVCAKRTNRPGISTTNRAPRGGRFMRRARGMSYGGGGYYPRARGRGFRSRRANYYSPY